MMTKLVSLFCAFAISTLAASATNAAESCKIKILKTGEIQVAASDVQSNPRWGMTLSNIGATFFNEGTCYDGGGLKLKKCNIGNPTTLAGIVPPFNCQICVGDDGPDDCCVFAKGCSPGMRIKDASFPANDPRIEAVEVPDDSTVRFTGVNLQIVNGTSPTWAVQNGTGNLIVGYNEQDSPAASRTGSHNLIVGTQHGWTGYSGVALGYGNRIQGGSASVTGGANNIAEGYGAIVSGGFQNYCRGDYSSISGGQSNEIENSAFMASISGGTQNVVTGAGYGSVTGGAFNRAEAYFAAVSGGHHNQASASRSSISGGGFNQIDAAASQSSIVGGYSNNIVAGITGTIVGGRSNFINAQNYNTIGGGYGVSASGAEYSAFHAGRTGGFPTGTEY